MTRQLSTKQANPQPARPAPTGSGALALSGLHPALRLRLFAGDVIAIGPGKAALLAAIEATGSISAAARELGMSYKRGWDLVSTMNESFVTPLVATSAGGAGGGGTQLTPLGERVLREYQRMNQMALDAIAADLRRFRKHLK